MLAKDEDDLEEATATRIFDSVRKFYIAVVNQMIKILPFHDDVLGDLAALKLKLRQSWGSSSVRELAIHFNLVADEHHDSLVDEFQGYQLTSEDEPPLYSADSRVDTSWSKMAKKKTVAGGMCFPH